MPMLTMIAEMKEWSSSRVAEIWKEPWTSSKDMTFMGEGSTSSKREKTRGPDRALVLVPDLIPGLEPQDPNPVPDLILDPDRVPGIEIRHETRNQVEPILETDPDPKTPRTRKKSLDPGPNRVLARDPWKNPREGPLDPGLNPVLVLDPWKNQSEVLPGLVPDLALWTRNPCPDHVPDPWKKTIPKRGDPILGLEVKIDDHGPKVLVINLLETIANDRLPLMPKLRISRPKEPKLRMLAKAMETRLTHKMMKMPLKMEIKVQNDQSKCK